MNSRKKMIYYLKRANVWSAEVQILTGRLSSCGEITKFKETIQRLEIEASLTQEWMGKILSHPGGIKSAEIDEYRLSEDLLKKTKTELVSHLKVAKEKSERKEQENANTECVGRVARIKKLTADLSAETARVIKKIVSENPGELTDNLDDIDGVVEEEIIYYMKDAEFNSRLRKRDGRVKKQSP